jgi:hypothetical protein
VVVASNQDFASVVKYFLRPGSFVPSAKRVHSAVRFKHSCAFKLDDLLDDRRIARNNNERTAIGFEYYALHLCPHNSDPSDQMPLEVWRVMLQRTEVDGPAKRSARERWRQRKPAGTCVRSINTLNERAMQSPFARP